MTNIARPWERDKYGRFLYKLYVDERRSLSEVAKILKITSNTLKKWLRLYGIEVRAWVHPRDIPLPIEVFHNEEKTGLLDRELSLERAQTETHLPKRVLVFWAKHYGLSWRKPRMYAILDKAMREFDAM
jgi:transposase-like protein